MSRRLFLKIVDGITNYTADPLPGHFGFFRVRPDATGRMSLSVTMKCTAAIRHLAYGTTPDAFDEYLQMSEHTARDCLFHFNKFIIFLHGRVFKKPTLEGVENIYNKHLTRHGFSGMLGSIDCSNNDINVLDNSPLFDDLFDDKAFVAPYVVTDVVFEKGYYLADGIYPQLAIFVKSFTFANDAKHAYFKKLQESARKDVERAFGVFQERWRIIQQPARQYHVNTIRQIMYSCIIMHNMVLKDQKIMVFDWNDVYANPSGNMQHTWIERCDTQRRKNKELRDREMHVSLQQNLMEHIWQQVEHEDEEEDF
nr:hypothetical protein [Tanacetum cinerariifolium]